MLLALAPAAMTVLFVQVTTCPTLEQVQPVPVADRYVSAVGSVSTTVYPPLLAVPPTLLTAIVKVPFVPCTKLPVCVLRIVRSVAGTGGGGGGATVAQPPTVLPPASVT